jgi:isoleucyl-tRNA synthetase
MAKKTPHAPHFLEGEIKLPEMEGKVLAFWDEHNIFEKSLEATVDGKPFTFYDGPPFATGLPHYGHILASTIKDVVPRYQTMNGRYVRRRWGWDCHGLPIEEIVERKLGISGKKQIEEIGIKKFNETCRSMVLQYVSEWREMIRRIARWVDFDDSYKTMDTDFMESVWWGFKQTYDKGLIYEGRKVLLYCPRCETPLSNFEVAMDNSYKDVTEASATVKFKLKPGQTIGTHQIKPDDKIYVLAWTTTPWTLPGDVALAVGPEIKYRALQKNGEYLIAAVDRLPDLGLADADSFYELTGRQLASLEYEPLFDLPSMRSESSYKIYSADFVTTTDGTGIVHIAPVHGEDDYMLGVAHGLPVIPLVDERGILNDKAPEFLRGQYFKKADALVIADLEERGLLFKKENITHSYPHCWRCGTMLYYNALPAWFVNIQKIKQGLLDSNQKEINWFPEHLKNGRYQKSVEAAPDWNISRNRYWGNPVPVWKCGGCDKVEAMGSMDELSEKAGGSKNNYFAIRHGESENIIFKIVDSGDQNCKLTPVGEKEVAHAAKKLKDKKIDLIFASDILRTKESAEIVAGELGLPVHYDKRLREINLGSFSGKPLTEYRKLFPMEDRFTGHVDEESESLSDVRVRAWDFLREIEAAHKGKNILIVSHEDTIWMLSQVAFGWGDKEAGERKWGTKRTGEKERFLAPAEIVEFGVKNIPRNDSGVADLHRPYIDDIVFPCAACGGVMRRTPEIFDSWIEAGSMPFAEYHYPFENKKEFKDHFPAQFVAEYIAQTRAWFYLSHVVSFILFGHAPFENVVTTGTILAEDGSKMSKSKGNFPDPKLLIDKFGADSLRFYLMNSVVMQADNLNFSEKGVEGVYRKVGMLLTNVYKYFATYRGEVSGHDDAGDSPAIDDNILDLWITARTEELVDVVTRSLDTYDTVHATRAIQEYVDDLSTWYLRRSRKRKDAGFFKTMQESLITTSCLLAPFMPFLAEAIYTELSGAESASSVHLAAWPKTGFSLPENERKELMESMTEIRRLASLALAKRAEAKIKVRQPLQKLTVRGAHATIRDERLIAILKSEINVKEVVFDPDLADEVALDTEISAELREEGLVREVARMFQELRQTAGLEPKDKVIAMMELPEKMMQVIDRNEALFMVDIGATAVEFGRSEKFVAEEATKLEGQEVWVAIRRV